MNQTDKQAYIFASMFALSNKMQILGDRLDTNITIKQWLFLIGVFKSESNTPTISEIAQITGYSRQNVKKMALILEDRGFVEVNKDVTDARVSRVSFTDKCMEFLNQIEDKGVEFITRIFADFDERTIDGLYNGLLQLSGSIQAIEKVNQRGE